MRKFVFLITLLMLIPMSSNASEEKLDLLLLSLKTDPAKNYKAVGKALSVVDGINMIQCLIRSEDVNETALKIEELGGEVLFKLKTIVGVNIPLSKVDAVSDFEEVDYIELSRELTSKMESARYPSMVDIVQGDAQSDHTNIEGMAYTGAGVVVGVVDDGLDYTHPDFSGSSESRIQYLGWVDGSDVLHSCIKEDIDDSACDYEVAVGASGSQTYHGTHVTSIAAGSNSTYKGVAPASDIIFFRSYGDADSGGTMATAVVQGVAKIFEKAGELKEAAVANLSLGTSIGAHDGTSALEEGLDELVTSG